MKDKFNKAYEHILDKILQGEQALSIMQLTQSLVNLSNTEQGTTNARKIESQESRLINHTQEESAECSHCKDRINFRYFDKADKKGLVRCSCGKIAIDISDRPRLCGDPNDYSIVTTQIERA